MKIYKKWAIVLISILILFISGCEKPPSSEPITETINNENESTVNNAILDDEVETDVIIENSSEVKYYAEPMNNFVQNNFIWFYKPPSYNSQINYLMEHYSFFILTKNDEWMRDELLAVNENLEIPEYILFNSIYKNEGCADAPWQNQIAFHQDDFCWIITEHPDWFLKSDDGKIIVDGDSVYIDPLADGWVDFFIERLHEAQTIFGWDGLFLDNLDGSLKRFSSKGVNVGMYPDDKSYTDAAIGFLESLSENYINPTGIHLYANMTYIDFSNDVWREYLQYLDGFMLEDWAVNWSDGYQKPGEWIAKINMVDESAKMGKKVFLVSQGNQSDNAHQTFAYASYLLVARENVYFRYTDALAYNEVWDFDNYSEKLGSPTCDYYLKDSVYIREFTNGRVVVDPKSEVAMITVFEE